MIKIMIKFIQLYNYLLIIYQTFLSYLIIHNYHLFLLYVKIQN
jgi:hypothetical protein